MYSYYIVGCYHHYVDDQLGENMCVYVCICIQEIKPTNLSCHWISDRTPIYMQKVCDAAVMGPKKALT